MDPEILKKIAEQDEKLALIYQAVEKTRKYMMWSFIVQLAVILFPLVLLMLAIPFVLNSLNSLSDMYDGLL